MIALVKYVANQMQIYSEAFGRAKVFFDIFFSIQI